MLAPDRAKDKALAGQVASGAPPCSPARRQGRLAFALATLLGGSVIGGTALSACAAGSDPPPPGIGDQSAAKILHTAVAQAIHYGAFHFTDESTGAGPAVVTTGDAGTLAGTQTVSGAGQQPLQAEVFDNTAYVQGPAGALASLLNLTEAQAANAGSSWISIPGADAHFARIEQEVSVAGELAPFVPGGNPHYGGVSTLQGMKVVAVTGPAVAGRAGGSGFATLYIQVASPHLPAGGTLVVTGSSGQRREAAAFTEWAEVVAPAAPAGAIPLSSLEH